MPIVLSSLPLVVVIVFGSYSKLFLCLLLLIYLSSSSLPRLLFVSFILVPATDSSILELALQ